MRKEYDFSQGKSSPVASALPGKVRITICIDADILNWFREKVNERGGGNYQTMMNDALRSCIQYQDKMLEETIRKVIQEELRAQGWVPLSHYATHPSLLCAANVIQKFSKKGGASCPSPPASMPG